MIFFLTETKERFDSFIKQFNIDGLFYSIYDKKLVDIEYKTKLVKTAYEIVFNSAKTDTPFDDFIREWYIDSDFYNEQYDDIDEEARFSIFSNHLCPSYNCIFDMCGGETSTVNYFGTDGIEYTTWIICVYEYSIDVPIIREVLIDDEIEESLI